MRYIESKIINFIISVILVCFSSFIYGQNSINKEKLKNDFITDSLGCLGLRFSYLDATRKYIDPDTKKKRKKVLISNIDFRGFPADTLKSILGKENISSWRGDALSNGKGFVSVIHYWYYLTCDKKKTLHFLSFNGIVDIIEIIASK